MIEVREYQEKAKAQLRANLVRGVKRQILTAPTGSGKTEMAMGIIQSAIEKGSKVEFIVDRQALVQQTSKRFQDAGIEHGILMGEETVATFCNIRVCSAQTIESRGLRGADLYIVDECHEIRKKLLAMIKESGGAVIGMTASPFPGKLPEHYDEMVVVATTNQLIHDTHLCPFKVIAPVAEVDVSGLKVKTAGEWGPTEVGERILRIVGDVVPEWERVLRSHFNGDPQSTIVFAASIDDAEALALKFQNAGHDFRVVSSRTPDENHGIIKQYQERKCMGLVNCAVLSRGFDAPHTRILVDAYPIRKSFVTIIQRLGRIMRNADFKEYGVVIDHAGNWLGWREDILAFYEQGPPPLGDPSTAKKVRKKVSRAGNVCRQCHTVFARGDKVCSGCGAERPQHRTGTMVGRYQAVAGTLQVVDEVTGETQEYQGNLWGEMCTIAMLKCRGEGERALRMALASYKNVTGHWHQRRLDLLHKPPDPGVIDLMDRGFKAWLIAKKYNEKKSKEVHDNG